MKYALPIGRISGIRIFIHWTFFLLIGWIIFSNLKAHTEWSQILWTIGLVLSIFVCITLHELGHALMAKRFNVKTKHITLLPIGGVAQLESIPEKPSEELKVALAGPAVNLVIAALIFPFSGFWDVTENISELEAITSGNFLFLLMDINLWLAIFNLIPAFPMDGGRVFRAILALKVEYVRATEIATAVGKLIAIVFLFLGVLYYPVLFLIGVFVFLSGQVESRSVVSRFILKKHTLADALMHEIPSIERNTTLQEAADMVLSSQNKNFLVRQEGTPLGILTRDEIVAAYPTLGGAAKIVDLTLRDVLYFPVSMPLDAAMSELLRQKKPFALVKADSEVIGMIDEDNLSEFILLHSGTKTPLPIHRES